MKRGYENTYNILPVDAFVCLYPFLDPGTKTSLSSANKTLYQSCSDEVKSLRLFSPANTNAPFDVLSGLLKRYRNIRHLEFELSASEDYLDPFISYLKDNPLNRVCSLIVHEILPRKLPHTLRSQPRIETLNYKFLKAVIHPQLEHFTLAKASECSIIKGNKITPLLDNLLALKSFEFTGELGNYSFEKHANLTKLKFSQLTGHENTLRSLKLCTKLSSLSIEYLFWCPQLLPVLNEHTWPLRFLELPRVNFTDDLKALLLKFPLLEHFSVRHFNPNTEDLKAFKCPNLRTLKIGYSHLDDDDIFHLTQGLSNLEVLSLDCPSITGDGVVFLTEHCPKLCTLHLGYIQSLHRTGMEAIVKNCPAITHLELSETGPIAYDDLQYLIQKLANLRQIKLSNIDGLSKDQITSLKSHLV